MNIKIRSALWSFIFIMIICAVQNVSAGGFVLLSGLAVSGAPGMNKQSAHVKTDANRVSVLLNAADSKGGQNQAINRACFFTRT